ncbi:MAG: hypothetical protein E7652_00935 [Ruminococcaceae bacterium]|nr:hypothetical protein [Oscillospiraceae bacterium]
MKKIYSLNKYSEKILNIGLSICLLAYFGIFLHLYNLSEVREIKEQEISLMLENINMSILLVVVFALVLDIHIKRNDRQ